MDIDYPVEILSPSDGNDDVTAGFDSHEPRWPKDAPGGKGGEWRDDTPGLPSVSLPKVVPTKAIYRAQIPHDEVVAVSAGGTTRMRWDQSQKKFIRERKSGDGWAHQKTLNKKQAYDQLKNEDDWHSPGVSLTPLTPITPKKSAVKKATPESDGPISGVDYADSALGESAHAKEILSMLDLGYTPQQVVEMYKREDLGPGMAELLVHEVVKFKEMQSKKDAQTGTKASKTEDVPSSQTLEQPSPVVSPAPELSVDSADLPTGSQDTLIPPTAETDFDYRITTAKSGKSALAAAPYNSDTEDSMINEDKDSGLGYTYESPVEDFHGSGLTGAQVSEAVGDYSDNGYETVNPALRESGGDPAQFPEHMKALGYSPKRARNVTAGVDAAMAASPLSDDVVVERGVVDPSKIFGSGWEDADLTGRDWSDQGYVSTTAGSALAKFSGNGAGIQMRILVPAGTHAIGIEAATAGLSGEQELLLDRGLSFRVVHDHGMVDGRRKIDIEVVPTPKTKANTPEIALDVPADVTPSAAPDLTIDDITPSESSVQSSTYEGPSFEMPSSIPKAKLDRFRELRLKSQRADAHIEGAPALTIDETHELYQIHSSVMHQSSATAARIVQETDVDVALEKFMQNHDLKPEDVASYREELARRTRETFKDKKIAVRVTPGEIDKILSDGRFKTQFESGKSKGLKNTGLRANVEEQWFGLPEDYDPKKRPIYGYVMVDGVRPAGLGASDMFDVSTDALSQYGQIQVVLKDDVRRRTTAMFGDSLNNRNDGIPSPVDDPSWQSYSPAPTKTMLTRGLTSEDRSVDDHEFRAGTYAEAQIHGGVTLDDIDEIIFPTTPSAATRKKLDDAGVKWRVLNFKTAADSTPDERARALRIAEQDLAKIDEDITETEAQIKKFETKSKPTADEYRDDLKRLLTQRKKIADALPGLRSESDAKTPTKKAPQAHKSMPTASEPTSQPTTLAPPKVDTAALHAATQELAKLDDSIATTEQALASANPAFKYHIKDLKDELKSLQAKRAKVASQVAALAPPKEGSTELENIRIQLDSIAEEAKAHAQVVTDVLHKDNMGKVLTTDDLASSKAAEAALAALSARASKLAERELELRIAAEGAPWGGEDPPGSWKGTAETKYVPGTNVAKVDAARDTYVANDRQTIANNASLRTGEPTPAAKAWRGRMRSMVRSGRITRDTTVYRGAAFTPEMVMSLQPGTTLHDVGIMSTDDSEDGARFYIEARRSKLPGTLPVLFDIKVPEGTPGVDVGVGEFVFDADTSLRIVKIERGTDGVIRVIAEMIPPGKIKKPKVK